MSALKPCPFCGKNAQIVTETNEKKDITLAWVECMYCKARSQKLCVQNPIPSGDAEQQCWLDIAVYYWNCRLGDKK